VKALIRRSNSGSTWRKGNVIRLKGHRGTQNLGETVDVLTHDERGSETDNQVVAAVYPYVERRSCGEWEIVIDVNE
jgi:hypothetical protein